MMCGPQIPLGYEYVLILHTDTTKLPIPPNPNPNPFDLPRYLDRPFRDHSRTGTIFYPT